MAARSSGRGGPGSFAYSVAADRANRPVNFVSWYDAARFCNWLTTGDTEAGVYTLDGRYDVASILDHETGCRDPSGRDGMVHPYGERMVQGGVPQERRRDRELLGLPYRDEQHAQQ